MSTPSLCSIAECWISQYLNPEQAAQIPVAVADHLNSCTDCKPRTQHWQLLTASIATLPRTPVPQILRKRTLAQLIRPPSSQERRSPWMPWYVRAPLEGIAVVALLLTIVTAAPRIKRWYDHDIDRGLSDLSELVSRPDQPNTPSAELPESSESQVAATRDDFSGEDEEGEDAVPELDAETESIASAAESAYVLSDSGEKIRVGKSDIWRFMIKSDSPSEMRTKISELLRSIGVPKETPGINGIVAPGGIQFDLSLAPQLVPRIKQDLERIAIPRNRTETSPQDSFSWYKSRSRQKIADRQVRVVIWISQV